MNEILIGTMSAVDMVSLVCLIVTGGLCFWGIASDHFDDTLIQRAGLVVLGFAAFSRIPSKFDASPDTPLEVLIGQVGLVIYGAGTVIKLWKAKRCAVGNKERRKNRWRGRAADEA